MTQYTDPPRIIRPMLFRGSPMARPTPLRVWLLLALASCGTSDGGAIAPDAAPDAAVTVASDGAAPAAEAAPPTTADAALEAAPSVDAPSIDAAPPAIDTAMTAGPPGATCLVSSDCLDPLVCALGTCHSACLEDRDCPAFQRCVSAGAGRVCQLSGSTTPDAGVSDGPMSVWGLSRGSNRYRVTAIEQVSDGCALEPGAVVGMNLPVTYDETTSVISIGNLQGTPPMPSLGAGKVAGNMALLTRDNVMDEGGACSYHRVDSGVLRLFDHDKFTLHITEGLSMFSASCTMVPVGGGCVSSWQWTLEKAP
jgi:hypothetical protein